MKLKCRKLTAEYLIFAVIVLLYFIPRYLEYTSFVQINGIQKIVDASKDTSYILAIIFVIKKCLYKRKYSVKSLFIIILVLSFFTVQALIKQNNSIFIVIIFSLLFEERYLKLYLQLIYRLSVFLYILTVTLSYMGVIENIITKRTKFGSIWEAGGHGFGYSGQMIMMLMPIVFMYYFLHEGKVRLKDSIFWLLIDLVVFFQCRTIMGTILIAFFIILYHWSKKDKNKSKWCNSKIVRYLPLICCLTSYGLVFIYSHFPVIGGKLDVIVNGRLSVADRIIRKYGIKWLGTDFTNNTLNGKYEILDSEYVHMMVDEGLLYLIVALILCYFIIVWSQFTSTTLTLIWSLIFINAIFNNGIFGLVMNPFCIVVLPAIKFYYKQRCKKKFIFSTGKLV